jgi:tRNA(fMet)-specific endonuclease VapC
MWMLDTNICIYIIKRKPPEAHQRLAHLPIEQIAVSSVTLGELLFGLQKSTVRKKSEHVLRQFLTHVAILPWEEGAAEHYAEIRAHLERQGTPIGHMDLMIAAHARSVGATLVTHNSREFQRVPDLQWEDWV